MPARTGRCSSWRPPPLCGEDLGKSDGTPQGTVRVANLGSIIAPWEWTVPSSPPRRLRVVINTPFASGLWVSDGTPAGTEKLEGEGLPVSPLLHEHGPSTRVGDTVTFVSSAGPHSARAVGDGMAPGRQRGDSWSHTAACGLGECPGPGRHPLLLHGPDELPERWHTRGHRGRG